jgi:hypothetical protein
MVLNCFSTYLSIGEHGKLTCLIFVLRRQAPWVPAKRQPGEKALIEKRGSAAGSMRTLSCVALVLVVIPACFAKAPHFASTGRIGVLCIGDTSYGESPVLGWLSLDFVVQWQELPTDVGGVMSDEAAKKITRIYTPRTLERLVETYDVLLLLEPRMEWFSGAEMRRFRDSVELGVSSLLTLWPDSEGYLSLVESDLGPVYPQEFAPSFEADDNLPYHILVEKGTPPVLTPFIALGIERFAGDGTRPMHPKQGSTVWAWAEKSGVMGPSEDEYIISWAFGQEEAENWVVGVDVDEQWFSMGAGNRYGGDIILNIFYYSVGKALPLNMELIHGIRNAFFRFNVEKKLVLAVLEFVDGFGANTAGLERKLAQADDGKEEAERLYLESEYEGCYDQIKLMADGLAKLNEEAMSLKDRALFWVYITEWSVVSGTSVLAGFVLYSLMIRRRLYREVSVTRAY